MLQIKTERAVMRKMAGQTLPALPGTQELGGASSGSLGSSWAPTAGRAAPEAVEVNRQRYLITVQRTVFNKHDLRS